MNERLAALSVDLDEIPCYAAIHGLPLPDGDAAHAIYRAALPRFLRFFREEGIHATFFAIGRDLERAENRELLRRARDEGHEIANHSENHFYDLTRRDRTTIADEIACAGDRIADAVGIRPVGFRAPGYTITDVVFDALGKLGYAYDSSVFPCPTYYAAKVTAIAAIAARGRRSHSVIDDPRVLLAPSDPYRVGRPFHRRGRGMVELPIGLTRDLALRLPYIGTSVVLLPEGGARLLSRLAVGRPFVNLELHGIDLADAALDGLGALAPHQPDLRRSIAQKERSLRAAVATLRAHGYRFRTLREVATRFAEGGGSTS